MRTLPYYNCGLPCRGVQCVQGCLHIPAAAQPAGHIHGYHHLQTPQRVDQLQYGSIQHHCVPQPGHSCRHPCQWYERRSCHDCIYRAVQSIGEPTAGVQCCAALPFNNLLQWRAGQTAGGLQHNCVQQCRAGWAGLGGVQCHQ